MIYNLENSTEKINIKKFRKAIKNGEILVLPIYVPTPEIIIEEMLLNIELQRGDKEHE